MSRTKGVAEVPEGRLLTELQVVERLGLSARRVRWLTMNGHLQRGVTPDGRVGGIVTESVAAERARRTRATASQRLGRVLSYVFTWLP
jgi:hypothetical protein